MTRRSPIIVAAMFVILSWSVRSAAQSDAVLLGSYVVIKGGLGLGGSVDVHNDRYVLTESDEPLRPEIAAMDNQSDLNTSFGGQIEYVFGVHRFVGIGGLLGARVWRSAEGVAAEESMSIGFDAGIVPQARLPVSQRLEFYLSVPLSLTLSLLNEPKAWVDRPHASVGTALSVSPTWGFGLGVLAGARFAITSSFGLIAELGYQRYAFTHEVQFKVLESIDPMGLGTAMSLDFVTQQARLTVGVFF
jgi:hypothetical protein